MKPAVEIPSLLLYINHESSWMPLWIFTLDNFTFAVVLNQLIFEAKDFISELVFSPNVFTNIPSQNVCTPIMLS